jgi:secondary thiamine-phosphate synthase enzyme
LRRDVEDFLSRVVPEADYEHDEIDDNADSHLRATLLGPKVTIPVTEGTLDLGTWQSVFLIKCDGPRRRTVVVG